MHRNGSAESTLAVVPLNDIDDVKQLQCVWNSYIKPGNLSFSADYLATLKHVKMPGLKALPLLLRDEEGSTKGVAIAYTSEMDIANLSVSWFQKFIRATRCVFPSFMKYSILEMGNPAAFGLAFHSSANSEVVLRALTEWSMAKANADSISLVMFRDFAFSSYECAARIMAEKGFFSVLQPAYFALPITNGSFEEYIQSMSKRYRYNVKNNLRVTAGQTIEVISDYSEHVDLIYEMWFDLNKRKDKYQRAHFTKEFYLAFSALDQSKIILMRRSDGSASGFGLMYEDGAILRLLAVGFTKEAAKEEGVYYRLLYETVRYAHQNKFKTVAFGITAAGPKMSLGARPVSAYSFVKHRNPMVSYLFSKIVNNILKPEPPVVRNVFKDPREEPSDPAWLGYFSERA